ncbi:hypothetical protein JW916_10265 [Candidatus Sumerlaeota bacterium]|nr:hypothetical protein [Candidatus Sumerlaeota bacterium]
MKEFGEFGESRFWRSVGAAIAVGLCLIGIGLIMDHVPDVASPAMAGTPFSSAATGLYVTSNEEGDTLYMWSVTRSGGELRLEECKTFRASSR